MNPTTPSSESDPVWRPALVLFVLLSLVTGLLYPFFVTGVAQAVFPTRPTAA